MKGGYRYESDFKADADRLSQDAQNPPCLSLSEREQYERFILHCALTLNPREFRGKGRAATTSFAQRRDTAGRVHPYPTYYLRKPSLRRPYMIQLALFKLVPGIEHTDHSSGSEYLIISMI